MSGFVNALVFVLFYVFLLVLLQPLKRLVTGPVSSSALSILGFASTFFNPLQIHFPSLLLLFELLLQFDPCRSQLILQRFVLSQDGLYLIGQITDSPLKINQISLLFCFYLHYFSISFAQLCRQSLNGLFRLG